MTRLYRTASGTLDPLYGSSDSLPPWFQGAYRGFRRIILGSDPLFPCYFAPIAERHGSLLYSFLSRKEALVDGVVYSILDDFLFCAEKLEPFPVLALFVETERMTIGLKDDEVLFWKLVNRINHTRTDWGSSESDATNPRWLLKYKQTPIFVTGHSPYYRTRLSRYADYCLTLVIQEKQNLTKISQDPAKLKEVMNRIRNLVDKYDKEPRCPLLGFYGSENVFDWKQFWLPDSNEFNDLSCKIEGP